MKHLWEIDHPYYCNEGNYFKSGHAFTSNSWADFFEEFGEADKDMNLVFRWDWHEVDDEWETDTLQVFFIGQRKGYFFSYTVSVTKDDEPAVRKYLTGYAEHMRKIWEPLL